MSLFVQDTFAEAHRLGVTDGFVGTFAELHTATTQAVYDAACWDAVDEAAQEAAAELAAEQYFESGWPGADQYRWEEEQDRLRNPFDPQAHYLEVAA